MSVFSRDHLLGTFWGPPKSSVKTREGGLRLRCLLRVLRGFVGVGGGGGRLHQGPDGDLSHGLRGC